MTNTKLATVVPLRQDAEQIKTKSSEAKWGKPVIKVGYSIVPSLIFKAQCRLGLSSVQLVVLLQLADHWWDKGRLPCPSKRKLAERMNLTERQVQRILTDLEKGEYIKRIARLDGDRGQRSNDYDLSGLVAKLNNLAPEFIEVQEQSKDLNSAAQKRGGLKVRAKPKTD